MTLKIEANCPDCGLRVDDATAVDGSGTRPQDGDLALCIRCAAPAYYAERDGVLILRALTTDEKVELSEDSDVTALREKISSLSEWFQP